MIKLKNAEKLGNTLLLIDRMLGLHTRTEATCCGVTLPQCHSLIEIGRSGKTSVKALADSLGVDKSTMSRIIDGLVDAGMVERSLDADDRRYVVISLAENGLDIFQKISCAWYQFCSEIMKNIPIKKQDLVIESLQLIAESLLKSGAGKKFSELCCKPKEEK
jgi:DNA-binding MarR family transcriptional regulator